jgi:hypothetical protein
MNTIQVGTVCGTSVYVGAASNELLKRRDSRRYLLGRHLHVVNPNGSLLSLKDLKKMHLGDDDIRQFALMCMEHTDELAAAFLPEGTSGALMHPASWFIDNEDKVRVSFLISGFSQQ